MIEESEEDEEKEKERQIVEKAKFKEVSMDVGEKASQLYSTDEHLKNLERLEEIKAQREMALRMKEEELEK